MSKTPGNVVAWILLVLGFIWFLQGVNVLPGSFMTGQIRWAVIGWLAMIAGGGLLVWVRRSKSK